MSETAPDVSVVIPCLNEEKAIGACIDEVQAAFRHSRINGEIIVVDNASTDASAQIAAGHGARVVYQSERGYGSAYLEGFKHAKGRYIVMADADNTYDFGEMDKFIAALKQGNDLVMGSRFKGKIHRGAMPWLNRYLGNPVLSGLCRIFFGTSLSDIHCGMRAFKREALAKMTLKCQGMEFATEMVMEALQRRLKVSEVPIQYYPRKGCSKLRPFADGWRHLRFMLLFCPTWLYLWPGVILGAAGLFALLLLSGGPVMFAGHAWDTHAMINAAFLTILGYQLINLGVFARVFGEQQGYFAPDQNMLFITRNFDLEKGILIGLALFFIGFGMNFFVFVEWWRRAFGDLHRIRESLVGITFMIIGLQTIFSSFFMSLLVMRR